MNVFDKSKEVFEEHVFCTWTTPWSEEILWLFEVYHLFPDDPKISLKSLIFLTECHSSCPHGD